MEPTVGIEPTTPALRMRCSAWLSYVGLPLVPTASFVGNSSNWVPTFQLESCKSLILKNRLPKLDPLRILPTFANFLRHSARHARASIYVLTPRGRAR